MAGSIKKGIVAAFVLALFTMNMSAAQASLSKEERAQAKELWQRGKIQYDIAEFREAARLYEAAFAITADYAMLFNIGQAYRLAGDDDKAILAYRAFLDRCRMLSNNRRDTDLEREVFDHILRMELKRREKQAAEVATRRGNSKPVTTTRQLKPRSESRPKGANLSLTK